MASVADVRALLPMKGLLDPEIEPHLGRAARDLAADKFVTEEDRVEAIASLAIYYVAPLFWTRAQNRINEYEETMQSYGDLLKFQASWKARSDSVPRENEAAGDDTINWSCP